MKIRTGVILVIGSLALVDVSQATAGSFTVDSGDTLHSAQKLKDGDTGTVKSGGTLSVSGDKVAVDIKGSSTIDNAGTIEQSGDGRAIRANSGGLNLTVTNQAGAVIRTHDADVIQMHKSSDSVLFDNYGTLDSLNVSDGGAQAIDFNHIGTGLNILNNYASGVIKASEADAVRPGVNGVINNDGLIKSVTATDSSSDGVDAQSNSGATIVNAANGGAGVAGTGTIEGARHGITGGNTDTTTAGSYTMNVTNNLGGTIQGDNGSGINIDGFNGNEVVTIVNHGTITGNGVTRDGDAVDVDGLVNLTNTGTIKSLHAYNDTSEGVTVGGGTIVNSGTIEGVNSATNADGSVNTGTGRGITLAGIDKNPNTDAPYNPPQGIYADTTVTNSGLIKGDSDAGIAVTGAANGHTVTIDNLAGGLIEGGGSAATVYTGGNAATVNDYGTITANGSGKAVDLGSGDSRLNILGGSARINGDISGGTGSSSLNIAPGAGKTFVYGGRISNFSAASVGAGRVVLNGANTYTGATSVNGGVLEVGDATHQGAGLAGGVTVTGGGALRGHGTVAGPVAVNDGVIQGGGATQPGNLTIDGALTQGTDGIVQALLQGSGSYSTISVNGALGLDGVLNIALVSGFNLSAGQIFDLLNFSANSLTGGFSNVYLGSLGTNGAFSRQGRFSMTGGELNYFLGGQNLNLTLSYNDAQGAVELRAVQASGSGDVPEPNDLGIMILGLAMLGWFGWRSRKNRGDADHRFAYA
ncbi:MAG: autotransporter-associated beta strand repeat-containing protein [Acidihalobacter sp.]|uniref:beta strand repeat-containing protein n=1 Tax=Acidihalobacter sp. TaxID=1872108 RepID=UPI00307F0E52